MAAHDMTEAAHGERAGGSSAPAAGRDSDVLPASPAFPQRARGGSPRRSRPVEGNHLLRVPVRWKSSGRVLSLALLGGISLTSAAGPMESGAFAFAAPSAVLAALAPLSAGPCAAMPPQANRTSLTPQ